MSILCERNCRVNHGTSLKFLSQDTNLHFFTAYRKLFRAAIPRRENDDMFTKRYTINKSRVEWSFLFSNQSALKKTQVSFLLSRLKFTGKIQENIRFRPWKFHNEATWMKQPSVKICGNSFLTLLAIHPVKFTNSYRLPCTERVLHAIFPSPYNRNFRIKPSARENRRGPDTHVVEKFSTKTDGFPRLSSQLTWRKTKRESAE